MIQLNAQRIGTILLAALTWVVIFMTRMNLSSISHGNYRANYRIRINSPLITDKRIDLPLIADKGIDKIAPSKANKNIPQWMEDYFKWHAKKRRSWKTRDDGTLNLSNTKFLVLTCLKSEECGELVPRINSLSYYIWLANLTKRVLLIKWTKPRPLEDFFVPPASGGLDWRVFSDKGKFHVDRLSQHFKCTGSTLHACLKMSNNRVESLLPDAKQVELRMEIFEKNALGRGNKDMQFDAEIFRWMFEPSPKVQHYVDIVMKNAGLVKGEYTSAHLRIFYPLPHTKSLRDNAKVDAAYDSIRCASILLPGAPVYFSSDSYKLVKYLSFESIFAQNKYQWVALSSIADGDAAENWKLSDHLNLDEKKNIGRPAAVFYSVFVDFWILASSRCVSYGLGQFGQYAARLTGNSATCSFQHRDDSRRSASYCPLDSRISVWDDERYVQKSARNEAYVTKLVTNRLKKKKVTLN
mmetsp:Transcript_27891/g.55916  ORF Transcript_27891/g.55916 Transcript_27891/m.55916 type:complete len:467 (+) Transcript_27891:86-1486(+)